MLVAMCLLLQVFIHGDPRIFFCYTQTNTYQAILITDRNSQSYAIFFYECNQTQWNRARSASGNEEYFARIGLSDGNGSSYIHPLSGNASVDIDCLNSPESTVVNILLDLNTFRPVEDNSSTTTPTPLTNISSTINSSISMAPISAQLQSQYQTESQTDPATSQYQTESRTNPASVFPVATSKVLSPTPTPGDRTDGGLTGGQIAGITVGVIAIGVVAILVTLIVVGIMVCMSKGYVFFTSYSFY